jgi:hypothetical protein
VVGKQEQDEPAVVQIKVQGNLDARWSDWFSGLTVEVGDEGEGRPVTTLTGSIDQATLRGILNRIWDLNLTLISVVPIEAAEPLRGAGR